MTKKLTRSFEPLLKGDARIGTKPGVTPGDFLRPLSGVEKLERHFRIGSEAE